MVKRSALVAVLTLVAVMSCAFAAEDPAPGMQEQLPPGVTIVGGQEPIPGSSTSKEMEQFFGPGFGYRHRFRFPFGGGFRYGWRYPIGWWNSFGRYRFGPSCMFGRPFGGFFYC